MKNAYILLTFFVLIARFLKGKGKGNAGSGGRKSAFPVSVSFAVMR
jgi:hypothetical protein